MSIPKRVVNKNVIEKNENKFGRNMTKNDIHHSLEGGQRIGQSERHYEEFIMPFMCSKCRLLHISRFDMQLMISRAQVQLREDLSTMKLVQQFVNCWNWKTIFNSDSIESYIINTKFPRSIFLFYQQDRGRKRTGAWANNTFLQHFTNQFFDLRFLVIGVPIRVDVNGGGVQNQWNVVMELCEGGSPFGVANTGANLSKRERKATATSGVGADGNKEHEDSGRIVEI